MSVFTRENVRGVWMLTDQAPDWLRDTVRAMHGSALPSDLIYALARDAYEAAVEADGDDVYDYIPTYDRSDVAAALEDLVGLDVVLQGAADVYGDVTPVRLDSWSALADTVAGALALYVTAWAAAMAEQMGGDSGE